MQKKLLIAVLSFAGIGATQTTLKAQEMLGLQNSNFAGTHAIYLNPANIATPGNIFYFNFLSRGVGFDNDFLKYNAPIKLNQWANGTFDPSFQGTNGRPAFAQSWLEQLPLNGESKNFHFHQDIRALSMMFPVSRKAFVSMNMRQRTGIQILGMDEPFARIARFGINNSKSPVFGTGANDLSYGQSYGTRNGFKAHFESWQEYSFTLAGIMKESRFTLFSGGLTLKYLRGMGVGHLSSKDLNLTVENGDSLTLNSGSFRFAHSRQADMLDPLVDPSGWGFNATTGHGAGFDLGFTLLGKRKRGSFRPKGFWDWGCDYRRQYNWKLGASLMDIGFISHNSGIRNYNATLSSPTGLGVRSSLFNNFQNDFSDGFDPIDNDVMGAIPGIENKANYTTTLPAALSAQLDLRLGNRFYVGVNAQQGLKPVVSSGLNARNFISVIPRWEGYFAEFAVPVTSHNNFETTTVGFYARFWVFHIGSDNLGGLMNVAANTPFTGASIYGGFALPIPYCRYKSWIESKAPVRFVEQEEFIDPTDEDSVAIDTIEEVAPVDSLPPTEQPNIDSLLLEKDKEMERKEQALLEKQRELEKRIEELERRPTNTTPGTNNCADCERRLRDEKRENDRLRNDLALERERQRTTERENNILRDRIASLENERTRLESRLRSCEATATNPNTRIIELERRVSELETERVRATTLRAQCDNDRAILSKRLENLEKELADCYERHVSKDETNSENLRLRERIKNLENEKRNLELLITQCDNARKELEVRVAVLEKDKENTQREITVLRKTVEDLSAENERLRRSLVSARDSVIVLKERLVKAEKDKTTCEQELSQLKTKVQTIENERNNCNLELARLKTRIAELEKQVATPANCEKEKEEIRLLTQRLKSSRDSVVLLQNRVLELDNARKTCETNSKQLQSDLDKAKAQIVTLENRLKDCNTTDNTKEVSELRSRITTLEAQTKKCEEDKAKFEAELKNLRQNQGDNDQIIKRLRDSLSWVKSDLEYCNIQYQNTLKEFQAVAAKLTEANKQLKECNDKLKACNTTSSSTSSSISTTESEQELRKKIADLEDKVSDLTKNLAEKQGQLEALKKEETALQNKLKQCESSLQTTAGAAEKIASLEASLKTAQTALTASQAKEKEWESKLKVCETEKAALAQKSSATASNDELNAKITALEKEKSTLQQQLESAKNITSQREKELSTLKSELEQAKKESLACKDAQIRYNALQKTTDSLKTVSRTLQRELENCNPATKEEGGPRIPTTSTETNSRTNTGGPTIKIQGLPDIRRGGTQERTTTQPPIRTPRENTPAPQRKPPTDTNQKTGPATRTEPPAGLSRP